ncbi:MAG: monovalent cation/H(+) antiporter subunit G [Bacillota bacterium]
MEIRILISYILMGMSGLFAIVTMIGLLRFPDVYTRIHAGAVVLTVSGILLALGVAIYVWEFYISIKVLLIGLIFLVSNPMATHAIAKASYRRGIALPRIRSVDEYSEYLEREKNNANS